MTKGFERLEKFLYLLSELYELTCDDQIEIMKIGEELYELGESFECDKERINEISVDVTENSKGDTCFITVNGKKEFTFGCVSHDELMSYSFSNATFMGYQYSVTEFLKIIRKDFNKGNLSIKRLGGFASALRVIFIILVNTFLDLNNDKLDISIKTLKNVKKACKLITVGKEIGIDYKEYVKVKFNEFLQMGEKQTKLFDVDNMKKQSIIKFIFVFLTNAVSAYSIISGKNTFVIILCIVLTLMLNITFIAGLTVYLVKRKIFAKILVEFVRLDEICDAKAVEEYYNQK